MVGTPFGKAEGAMGEFLSENWLVIVVVGVFVAAFIFLRTTPDELASEAEFAALVTSGRPTLVEFFSNS
jgi:hypothetical protein